jgi:AcrR family transcriptional regulator
MSPTTPPTTDPRIERTRQVVLAAALELISETGFARVTIEAIGERSGVARSTIYRHWKQLPDLMLDALAAGIQRSDPPDTGELRSDLIVFVSELAELLTSDQFSQMAMALIVESHRDPAIAELHARFLQGRQQFTIAAIQRGIARDELPATVDPPQMAADLAAPVFFRALIQHAPVDAPFIEQHVDRWLAIHRTPTPT